MSRLVDLAMVSAVSSYGDRCGTVEKRQIGCRYRQPIFTSSNSTNTTHQRGGDRTRTGDVQLGNGAEDKGVTVDLVAFSPGDGLPGAVYDKGLAATDAATAPIGPRRHDPARRRYIRLRIPDICATRLRIADIQENGERADVGLPARAVVVTHNMPPNLGGTVQ